MEEQNSNIEIYNENSDNNSSQSQDKKPIYVMSLELEDGNTAKIKIYSDSNPEVLSKEFCEKNNLEPEAAEYLSSQIEALIAQFNNEEYNENENNGEENEENEEENYEDMQMEEYLFKYEIPFNTLWKNRPLTEEEKENLKSGPGVNLAPAGEYGLDGSLRIIGPYRKIEVTDGDRIVAKSPVAVKDPLNPMKAKSAKKVNK